MSSSMSRVDAKTRAATPGERESARWQARLILVFVGLPGAGLTLYLVLSLGAAWGIVGMGAALLNSGVPIAIVASRRIAPEMLLIGFPLWLACFAAVGVSAVEPTAVGEFFPLVVAALSAATSMAVCAWAVSDLLANEGRAPVQTAPGTAPAGVEVAPLANVDAQTGWRMWWQRCVSPAKGGEVRAEAAYTHYQLWAAANGVNAIVAKVSFGQLVTRQLESVGASAGHSNGRVYRGITLADLGEASAPLVDPQEVG